MSVGEKVNLINPGQLPDAYHCDCENCRQSLGELRRSDGSYYSRLERREYYDKSESGKGGHIAKTPLHIARWAVQAYTEPGDWVLDPTLGSGTSAVEAITQGRSAAGIELQYAPVLEANINKNLVNGAQVRIKAPADARGIRKFLNEIDEKFTLVINNPPYSGDASFPSPAKEGYGPEHRQKETYFFYEEGLPNLAFLNEGPEYWQAIGDIYAGCIDRLETGGHFVTGVKDMMRNKKPFMLHQDLNHLMEKLGLEFVGTAFLKHYPTTMFLNTYFKMYGVHPPYFQTIGVWRKP